MNKKNVLFIIGIILLLVPVVLGLTSFFYTPHPPNTMNVANRMQYPSMEHWLGTDQFGRDILSRIMVSSRYALFIGITSVFFGSIMGVMLGALGAISKGILRGLIMRMIDGLMAFPGVLLAMMFVAALGEGIWNTILAISIFMIPVFARLSYSLVLEQQDKLYIKAAKTYGVQPLRMIYKHYLPAITPRIVTQFSASIGGAILTESSLSFLGLGVQPPNASWGLMLNEAQQYMLTFPYLTVPSGVILMMTVLGFNLVGDQLNDILVRRRGRN